MGKKLIIVINNEISLGLAMNAVGHMMMGLGVRLPKGYMPSLSIYGTSSYNLHQFRLMTLEEEQRIGKEKTLRSDFAHTTTNGNARDHQATTSSTKEIDLNYFAACFSAEKSELEPIESTLLKDGVDPITFIPLTSEEVDFNFYPPISCFDDFVEDDTSYRFSMAVHRQLTPDKALASVAYGYLQLSRNTPVEALRLHTYIDASGTEHPGMSEYGLVVLKPSKNTAIDQFADKDLSGLLSYSMSSITKSSKVETVALFGPSDHVKKLTNKGFQLWQGKLDGEFSSPYNLFTYSPDGSSRQDIPDAIVNTLY